MKYNQGDFRRRKKKVEEGYLVVFDEMSDDKKDGYLIKSGF